VSALSIAPCLALPALLTLRPREGEDGEGDDNDDIGDAEVQLLPPLPTFRPSPPMSPRRLADAEAFARPLGSRRPFAGSCDESERFRVEDKGNGGGALRERRLHSSRSVVGVGSLPVGFLADSLLVNVMTTSGVPLFTVLRE